MEINKYLLKINECSGCGMDSEDFYTDVEDLDKDYDEFQTQYGFDLYPDYQNECNKEINIDSPSKRIKLPKGDDKSGKKPIMKIVEQDEELQQSPVETPMRQDVLPSGGEAGENNVPIPQDVPSNYANQYDEEKHTTQYIGYVFELKKIYSRLVSIENFLNDTSDTKLLILRKYVSSAIELFQTLINNVSNFKKNISDIIILYYKFLLIVYTILKKYYRREND